MFKNDASNFKRIKLAIFVLFRHPFCLKGTIEQQKKTTMQTPITMTSLLSVLEKLRIRKQDNEFKMTPEGFTAGKGKVYQAEELKIIKTYRFEGDDSSPSDSSIIYLIEANDGLIGYSLDAYGVYSNHDEEDGYDEFIRKLPMEERDEQQIFGEGDLKPAESHE